MSSAASMTIFPWSDSKRLLVRQPMFLINAQTQDRATPNARDPIACIPMPLRVAVQAAIHAYAKSGRMLDAALAYAAHGYPVFPLSKRTKAPIPKADKDV